MLAESVIPSVVMRKHGITLPSFSERVPEPVLFVLLRTALTVPLLEVRTEPSVKAEERPGTSRVAP